MNIKVKNRKALVLQGLLMIYEAAGIE